MLALPFYVHLEFFYVKNTLEKHIYLFFFIKKNNPQHRTNKITSIYL